MYGHSADRRSFLKAGLGGMAALACHPFHKVLALGNPRSSARTGGNIVVFLDVLGGYDGLNILPPHGLGSYFTQRPTIAVPPPGQPGGALDIGSGYGFHPVAPALFAAFQNGEVAPVRLVGYPMAILSHFQSRDVWSFGFRDLSNPEDRGWLGRLADLAFNQTIELVGITDESLKDLITHSFTPLILDKLDSFSLPVDPNHMGDSAFRNQKLTELIQLATSTDPNLVQIKSSTESAFAFVDQIQAGIAGYPGTVSYPSGTLGSRLRDIARLIFADLGTTIYYTRTSGFDHHANLVSSLNNRLADLDASLGAFINDMKGQGRYNQVTIVVFTEFGRRNFENGSTPPGTDHGAANVCFVVGGAVNGGLKGPALTDPDVLGDYLQMAVDFRQVFFEILQNRLGFSASLLNQVFFEPFNLWPGPGGSLNLF